MTTSILISVLALIVVGFIFTHTYKNDVKVEYPPIVLIFCTTMCLFPVINLIWLGSLIAAFIPYSFGEEGLSIRFSKEKEIINSIIKIFRK